MAEEQNGTDREIERAPGTADLLRAALEKIVFFEWRVSELGAELAKAHDRAAAAEAERAQAHDARAAAEEAARIARQRAQSLESERARVAALLAAPRAPSDAAALRSERDRSLRLEAELAEAREELSRQEAERGRWLEEMLAQARARGGEPEALAAFISELRGEVIALRERNRQAELRLRAAGLEPPPEPERERTRSAPPGPPTEPIERARELAASGRLSAADDVELATRTALLQLGEAGGAAARALGEQALRSLTSHDPARRAQSARHLAAVPIAAAAPALAAALAREDDAAAKAALAAALVGCGGDGAAEMVARLQSEPEHALVRLAALDALCSAGPDRRHAALQRAACDPAAAVRRRAAALAVENAEAGVLAVLLHDADRSVRAAASTREPDAAQLARAPAREPASEAITAVQAAIFGLTEPELAGQLAIALDEANHLAARLVASGRLARRGKRLVLAAPLAAAEGGT